MISTQSDQELAELKELSDEFMTLPEVIDSILRDVVRTQPETFADVSATFVEWRSATSRDVPTGHTLFNFSRTCPAFSITSLLIDPPHQRLRSFPSTMHSPVGGLLCLEPTIRNYPGFLVLRWQGPSSLFVTCA